ncbi:MAG: RING finger protein, partial [Candidatus Thorarchaeota archaeon]
IVNAPSGTQILLFHRLQNRIDPNRIKSIFLTLGDEYLRNRNRIKAAVAFNYAGLPWKAAQVYILEGMDYIDEAIRVIDDNPLLIRDRERAIRNLAKFAFENQHIVEAAELLRIIGAEEEASAILVASGKTIDTLPQRRSEKGIDSINQQLHLAIAKMKQGKFQETEELLMKVNPLINTLKKDTSIEVQNLLRDFTRIQTSLRNLKRAREAYKNNQMSQAQVAYSELLDYAGEYFPAEVYAEAGLAYEQSSPEISREYYLVASEKGVTSQAQTTYRNRAQNLLTNIPVQVAKSATPAKKLTPLVSSSTVTTSSQIERCSICKMPITPGEEIAKCGSCESIGHYGHLAEWIKIKGTCPVCRKKLVLPERKLS